MTDQDLLPYYYHSINQQGPLAGDILKRNDEAHEVAADISRMGLIAVASEVEASLVTGTPTETRVPDPIDPKMTKPFWGFTTDTMKFAGLIDQEFSVLILGHPNELF